MEIDFPYSLTPYNDEYETCESTYAVLCIYSGEIDPDVITQRLNIQPSEIDRIGLEHPPNSIGRKRIGKLNTWFLSSEDSIRSKDLRHHLDWLLEKVIPAKDVLKKLQKEPGIKMTISCSWWSAYGDGGPTLWPKQMGAIADLGLECGFDIYFVNETLE